MRLICTTLCLFLFAATSGAQTGEKTAQATLDPPARQARELNTRAAKYLVAAQEKDGGWASQAGPGVTGLVLKALIQEPAIGPQHTAVRRGLDFMRKFQREDGGIYSAEGLLKNYETSVALAALAALNDPQWQEQITAAQKFLKDSQWDEGEARSVDDAWYGGAGYGQHKRPDLSNTQMMLEALRDSGLPKDDPVYKKALAFIQRCQMRGESNDQAFAKNSTDGGFVYTPANGGESKAGFWEVNGRPELRSYGSMTYAGFKSMLYAGLARDDPRVKAALDWIRRYWTLDFNPNMPAQQSQQGVYYYYHVFARAMAAWGEPEIADQAGRRHNWRHELASKLAELQRSEGSWVNEADRWMEGLPVLTTAYGMLAIQAAYPGQPSQ
ncbi:MAG: terpene cyclase/mutase family protein [Planctomycetes bacterium]|nr:terpene cyclase/mutase family protein [Planctomycetota bacterium]